MRVGRHETSASFESKLDLTPLIDCIFQLILFLVLTSQITVQAEEVELPFALEGKEIGEDKQEVPPLIVNVVRVDKPGEERFGRIVFGGRVYEDDDARKPNPLTAQQKLGMELKKEAEYDAAPRPMGRGRGWEAGPGGRSLSKLSVIVRADKGVRSEYIRTVFMSCQEAAIYRIKVSSTMPTPQ
jgi:biopolymer transport protein ExbD